MEHIAACGFCSSVRSRGLVQREYGEPGFKYAWRLVQVKSVTRKPLYKTTAKTATHSARSALGIPEHHPSSHGPVLSQVNSVHSNGALENMSFAHLDVNKMVMR